MSSDPISNKFIQRPAFHQLFKIGTIYNATTEEIIPADFDLFPILDLKEIETTPNYHTRFSLIESDELKGKLKNRNVSSSLEISILTGMIEPEGSASLLNSKKGSIREVSIQVRCDRLTAVKKLQIKLPSMQLDVNPLDITNNGATHVVTQIQYGAEATFTFTKQIKKTDDEEKVKASLASKGKYLVRALEGKAEVNFEDKNLAENNETDIECHFEGDFQLPKNVNAPTTYEEAVKFASDFTKILSDSIVKDTIAGNDALGVPCTVWLYPLVLLPGFKGTRALHNEIKDIQVYECKRIMEEYEETEEKLCNMKNESLTTKIIPFKKKMDGFQQHFNFFRKDLETKLRDSVISIRNGQEDVTSLKKLMEHIGHKKFSFNPYHLNAWLLEKHLEMCMLKRFQNLVKTNVKNQEKILFFPSSEKLQESMTDSKVRFGFEIAFNQIKSSEPFLELMKKQLLDMNVNEDEAIENKLNKDIPWYKEEQIEKKMEIFVKLINENFEDEAFALTAPDNEHEDDSITSGLSLVLYYEGIKYCGCSALLVLCKQYQNHNLEKIIRLLLGQNLDVNYADKEGSSALLYLCRYYRHPKLIDVIQILLEQPQPININCQDNKGWNALLYLCQFYDHPNLIDVIRLLLDQPQPININCQDNEGWNALLYLCRYYNHTNLIDIIQLLLGHQININCQDNEGWNALLYLCRYYNHTNLINIIQLLLGHQININCQDNEGWNALLYLCRYYNHTNLITIIKLLLGHQININCQDKDGWNALLVLCQNYKNDNLIDIVQHFIHQNIEVKAKTNDGWNALHLVCRYYKKNDLVAIVKLLLEKEIDINDKENEGWNALHFVCRYQPKSNLMDLVQLLIQHNIEKDITTTGGRNRKCTFFPTRTL